MCPCIVGMLGIENKKDDIISYNMFSREDLLKHLKENTGVLRSEALEEAFLAVDRADFVPKDCQVEAYEDYPLPIGAGQTISQPTTVFFMLELLSPGKGHKVLDIGSGSGWTTALLSQVVGKEGEVTGLEIVSELVQEGRENLSKYDFPQTEILEAQKHEIGLPAKSPYDRILVSAEFLDEIPQTLIDQLKPGGVLVAPVRGAVVRIYKRKDGEIEKDAHYGFAFVPYID